MKRLTGGPFGSILRVEEVDSRGKTRVHEFRGSRWTKLFVYCWISTVWQFEYEKIAQISRFYCGIPWNREFREIVKKSPSLFTTFAESIKPIKAALSLCLSNGLHDYTRVVNLKHNLTIQKLNFHCKNCQTIKISTAFRLFGRNSWDKLTDRLCFS